MENENYVLKELNEGLSMGMDAISNLSPKVLDTNLKNELIYQYNQYNSMLSRVTDELSKYKELPKKTNQLKKTMSWMDIEVSTLNDKSNSNIANMMIRGTTMGVINGIKLSNENPGLESNVKDILSEFIEYQQNSIEQLKTYL